jgi:hypothetical protein
MEVICNELSTLVRVPCLTLLSMLGNLLMLIPGSTNREGRLSTVDLLIRVACFVKKENNNYNIKMS